MYNLNTVFSTNNIGKKLKKLPQIRKNLYMNTYKSSFPLRICLHPSIQIETTTL